MGESSIIWLRVAAGLYLIGLFDSVLTVLRRKRMPVHAAMGACGLGALFQLVSIVDQWMALGQFPVSDIFQTMSFCSWVIMVAFLALYYRYKAASFSVFIFPVVFLMTLVAALRSQSSAWSNPTIRSTWLVIHVVLSLLGYAALLFTAAAAVVYLVQERQLKRKSVSAVYRALPPLGTLDELISRSLGAGFAFVTAGIVIGSIWASKEMGSAWIGNSSIAISFVTWAVYLALVFVRVGAGWRGRKTAILSIVALACCIATWLAHAQLERRLIQ
jgi:ABC-type transport system involved in cytochrome c biogenesis permease subunit